MEIKQILEVQEKLNKNISPYLDDDEVITRLILSLYVEVGEFANEVQSFKYWKKNKDIDKEKLTEEFVDVIKIWGSLANYLDISEEDIHKAFFSKSKKCELRQKNGY